MKPSRSRKLVWEFKTDLMRKEKSGTWVEKRGKWESFCIYESSFTWSKEEQTLDTWRSVWLAPLLPASFSPPLSLIFWVIKSLSDTRTVVDTRACRHTCGARVDLRMRPPPKQKLREKIRSDCTTRPVYPCTSLRPRCCWENVHVSHRKVSMAGSPLLLRSHASIVAMLRDASSVLTIISWFFPPFFFVNKRQRWCKLPQFDSSTSLTVPSCHCLVLLISLNILHHNFHSQKTKTCYLGDCMQPVSPENFFSSDLSILRQATSRRCVACGCIKITLFCF